MIAVLTPKNQPARSGADRFPHRNGRCQILDRRTDRFEQGNLLFLLFASLPTLC